MSRYGIVGSILLLSQVGLAQPAHAYLDPGTGSILLQGLIGGVVAVWATLAIYWHRIKEFFARRRNMKRSAELPKDAAG